MTKFSIAACLEDPIAHYPSATVACFDPTTGALPRRSLEVPRTIAYLERLAAAGAPALLLAASTGHGHLRTVDELAEWFVAAAAANVGECVRMALVRPEDGPEASCRLIDLVQQLGFSVVFVRPGTNLPSGATDRQIAEQMQPLVAHAAKVGLAVGVYSIPDVSGVPLTPTATALLIDGPGGESIVAAKVTEANYHTSTLRFLTDPRLDHLKIVQGWDTHLASALVDGPMHDAQGRQRCGVTSGPMSFAIHQYLHIFAAAAESKWDEVAAAQAAVTALFQSMQDDPTKFADLQRAKAIMGLGEPLTGTVSSKQIDRVLAALDGVSRPDDRSRLAKSLDLMGDGPYHARLSNM